jgi:hypothetical protein
MQYFGTSLGVIVKGKLQQRWSTIPPILVSIKGTTLASDQTFHPPPPTNALQQGFF